MNLLILGANSDIAYAVAKRFAEAEKADVILASRAMEALAAKAQDLAVRCQVKATPIYFDALDFQSHRAFYQRLQPKPDVVVAAFGYLGDQTAAQADFAEAQRIIHTNYLGAVSILEIVAEDFEQRRQGTIIGISSAAGERGRKSNYIYGSAKGALTIYLSGLRNRLSQSGVHVITVIPGYVRTKMTSGLRLSGPLVAAPEDIAKDMLQACRKSKNIIYSKRRWRIIMMIIKMIPESLFKRLSL